MAPHRHSAASTLSNSGEYILFIGPLLRFGKRLMRSSSYRCRFTCGGICSLEAFDVGAPFILGEHARSGACGPQSRALLSRLVLGEVHRSCLRSEFVRGVAAERYRFAQVVYGQCSLVERPCAGFSIVVSNPRFHNRRCGVDLTTLSPAPPLSS